METGGRTPNASADRKSNILGCRSRRNRANDVLNVVDGVGNTSVLCYALISEIDLAFGVEGDVLQQSVALDGVVDVRLRIFVQVDDFGVAATLKVEDAVVVPAVLVVADQQALRSVDRVVLPVPDRPKKMAVFLPSLSVLAEQCMEAMPFSGRK